MAEERPILVLTASAGAGHNIAAQAMAEALTVRAAPSPVEVIDILQWSNPLFRRLYSRGYLAMVKFAPWMMGWLYESMDRPGRDFREWLRITFQNMNLGYARRFLCRRNPRLVVNTHFLPAEIITQLRAKHRLDCPQVTVTTDFETHRMWAVNDSELFCTATDEGKAYLCTWGVPAERIRVTGIPVRAAFGEALDRESLRRELDIPAAAPVILLLSGGFGVGPTEIFVRALAQLKQPAWIIVVAGRNEKLRRRLSESAPQLSPRIRVIGFTSDMQKLMRAADLIVTKPGGLTVAEALACGVPLVVVNPIPGQETRNSDFLLEHGAAIKVNNPRLLGYRIACLLDEPQRLSELRASAVHLGRADAAGRIADAALALIGEPAQRASAAPSAGLVSV